MQSDIYESSKDQIYGIFKSEFGFQKYDNVIPEKLEQHLLNSEGLPVETGVAIQNMREIAISVTRVKELMNIIISSSGIFLNKEWWKNICIRILL